MRSLIFIAFVSVLSACGPAATATQSTSLPGSTATSPATVTVEPTVTIPLQDAGQIRFGSSSGQETGLYSINANGSNLTRLMDWPYLAEPAWSPDRKRIAFIPKAIGFAFDIYVINVGNNKPAQLTHFEERPTASLVDDHPVWSPKGEQIAFTVKTGTFYTIYIVNTSDGSLMPLGGGYQNSPAWSPDGEYIAFAFTAFEHSSPTELMVSAIDGQEAWVIGPRDANCENIDIPDNCVIGAGGVWSSDGQKIGFWSNRTGQYEIYVTDVDGSSQIQLTNTAAEEGPIVWSPNNQQIAVVSNRDGNKEIYAINVDGSGQTNLTNNPANDFSPAWSPDGKQIAFVSDRDGNREIYVMNADGSNQARLTNNDRDDWGPVWQPQPKP